MGDYEEREGALIHRTANLVGDIRVGPGSRIDAFVTLTGRVSIGKRCHISTGACVFGGEGVSIGDYSGLSVGAKVFTATEDLSGESLLHPTVPPEFRKTHTRPIAIGSHCSVGAGSVLLPGAWLPDGACVGALSLVKTELMGWAIYAGIPVRLVRFRSRKALELQHELEKQCTE